VKALVITVVLVAVAGCSGGDPSARRVARAPADTASAAPSGGPSGAADPVGYAQCMRRNGVADFPDPAADGGLRISGRDGLDPDSAAFRAAAEKCQEYMPAGEKNGNPGADPWSADLKLQYAGCMRANGVPSFPDPDADGRFPALAKGGQVDPDTPQFQQADTACARYKPQNTGVRSGPQGGAR
jgi:hypothetical protein